MGARGGMEESSECEGDILRGRRQGVSESALPRRSAAPDGKSSSRRICTDMGNFIGNCDSTTIPAQNHAIRITGSFISKL